MMSHALCLVPAPNADPSFSLSVSFTYCHFPALLVQPLTNANFSGSKVRHVHLVSATLSKVIPPSYFLIPYTPYLAFFLCNSS